MNVPEETLTESLLSGPETEQGAGAILFILNALGIGGSERKTVSLVNDLYRSGWNVHLAYLDARTPLLKAVSRGVPVTYLERSGKLSFSAIRVLRAYIRREGIRKVVCVGLYPFLNVQAALSLVPSKRSPAVILLVNRTEHAGKKERRQMLLYRPLIRRAQQVIFGCHAQLQLWLRRYRLDERKCGVIYNGIDELKFAPGAVGARSRLTELGINLADTDFIIGAVGTLWLNKNHIELISVLECLKDTLPNARLVIAGEGPERVRLEAAATASGLNDRVFLLGEIEDVRPLLNVTDVFVLPSISETFSNGTLEAMAMQKPVIVSNTGGMPEMVTEGVDGYLYEQGDVGYLAALIERLATDPTLACEIGKNAREAIKEKFTFERMANEYRELLS